MKLVRLIKEFSKGLVIKNPIFIMAVGFCPALAVTNTVDKALGMSAAFAIILVVTSLVVSLIRKVIPDSVRIQVFFIITATVVTMVQTLFQIYSPSIYSGLGIYLSLLAVNCIILDRVEGFAYKNNPFNTVADALGISIGFLLALALISFIRELLGTGGITIFGNELFSLPVLADHPIYIFNLSAGAFLITGLLFALLRLIGVIKNV
jgi:electron transport complex protein RnfE